MLISCQQCGAEVEAKIKTRRFCSIICQQRSHAPGPREKTCRHCGENFLASGPAECNRQYCSKRCARSHVEKRVAGWSKANAAGIQTRKRERIAKIPGFHAEKAKEKRAAVLALLGGRCVVCAVDNPSWLHVDYIPGTRGSRHRHPRHLAFVRSHHTEFRILCANHHYELTLTGRIEGTEIGQ